MSACVYVCLSVSVCVEVECGHGTQSHCSCRMGSLLTAAQPSLFLFSALGSTDKANVLQKIRKRYGADKDYLFVADG